MSSINEVFVKTLNKKMPKEKVKAILKKISNKKITWWDIEEIKKYI